MLALAMLISELRGGRPARLQPLPLALAGVVAWAVLLGVGGEPPAPPLSTEMQVPVKAVVPEADSHDVYLGFAPRDDWTPKAVRPPPKRARRRLAAPASASRTPEVRREPRAGVRIAEVATRKPEPASPPVAAPRFPRVMPLPVPGSIVPVGPGPPPLARDDDAAVATQPGIASGAVAVGIAALVRAAAADPPARAFVDDRAAPWQTEPPRSGRPDRLFQPQLVGVPAAISSLFGDPPHDVEAPVDVDPGEMIGHVLDTAGGAHPAVVVGPPAGLPAVVGPSAGLPAAADPFGHAPPSHHGPVASAGPPLWLALADPRPATAPPSMSFQPLIQPIPEPGTALLLAGGLLSLSLGRRRD